MGPESFLYFTLLLHAPVASEWAKSPELAPLHEQASIVQMLEQNNTWRAAVGLVPQRISAELTEAAQDHALFMASTGQFDHYINGGPSARAAKYAFHGSVRENIAMGYQTIEAAFSGWRSSPGHWASITCNAPLAGFGYAISQSGTAYWVGLYGFPARPQDRILEPSNAAEPTISTARRGSRRRVSRFFSRRATRIRS